MSKRHKLILTILIHLLTFIAGFLNGVFFIIAGTAVSHHTGTITRVALTLSQGAVAEAAAFLLLILSFYIGACISGMLFHKSDCTFSKRYGILLLVFSTVFFAIAVLRPPLQIVLIITCVILGIQNGMFIPYDGILIRTSHFSGYLTDAGLAMGKVMRGKRQELRRGVHYLSGIVCFAAGAAASAFMPSIAFFYIIAVFYFFTAVFYFAFIRARV
ncbi:YoaK family protein [uncultured Treponema sp.]|uniref:YoaK family protein n=1 Tax=uncultured Treponema sp. TaxID=162155 RepID=UPI0028E6815F|nr:YoaK family protein [uncultured Treponema sp.]